MNAPIIFIHYGDSEYLKYTLRCAVKFNKDKIVYLLGDNENKHYNGNGIIHVEFSDLHYGEDIESFEAGFKVIKGTEHDYNKYKGTDFWVKFVFLRWFYINNFLKKKSISSFWTFDSDTLIISDLFKFERELSVYDCTEQCNSSCLNGFISNSKIVDNYVRHINSLFRDEEYLKAQQEEFKENQKFAFTEMRAYVSFKTNERINSIPLSTAVDGVMFDDCLCQEQGIEMIKVEDGQIFKKLHQDVNTKALYILRKVDNKFLKLNTINLSWLSTYIIEDIYRKVVPHKNRVLKAEHFTKLEVLNFSNNLFSKVIRKLNRMKIEKT